MKTKAITNSNNKPTRIRHYSDDEKIDYTSKPPSKAPQWCIKKQHNSEQSSNMIHDREGINYRKLKKTNVSNAFNHDQGHEAIRF
jgi:hypothetical protein